MAERTVDTRYWEFAQNNSGGSFEFDEKAGITAYVVIEATSMDDAKARAEQIGLYWDGCESGRDCSCCGDRWSAPWRDDGDTEPMVSGRPPQEYDSAKWSHRWMDPGREICVHHIDGSKQWF